MEAGVEAENGAKLLPGFLPLACSTTHLTDPRPTRLGVVPQWAGSS